MKRVPLQRKTQMPRSAIHRTQKASDQSTEAAKKRISGNLVKSVRTKSLKTRRDPDDTKFSRRILERDPICVRCHRARSSENSHFFRRDNYSVRYDDRNGDGCCHDCHGIWEHQKHEGGEYRTWKINQLGPEEFEAMEQLANKSGLERVKKSEAKEIFRESLKSHALHGKAA